MITAKVVYGIKDSTIELDTITNVTSSNNVFSNADNTINNSPKTKIALFEKNGIKINDNSILPIRNNIYNVGWQAEFVSDINGICNETITYNFLYLHSTIGTQVIFPDNSIAIDYSIKYYNGTTLVKNITRTNNTTANDMIYESAVDWNKIILNITKTEPYKRAKLYDIKFGVEQSFNGNDLLSVDAMLTFDLLSSITEAGEASFTFINNRDYNIDNIKDIPTQFLSNLAFDVYFINEGIFEHWGKYFSTTPKFSDNNTEVTINGFDSLYRIGNSDYSIGKVNFNGITMYDLATEISNDCTLNIDIDNSLRNITTKGYVGFVPHREALRLVAEASNTVIIADKTGILSLKPHTFSIKQALTIDNIEDKTFEIAQYGDNYDGVSVNYYSYKELPDAVGLFEGTDYLLNGENQTFLCEYATYPAIVSNVVVSAGVTVVSQEIYSDRAVITINGTAGTTSFITIIGKAIKTSKATVSVGGINKKVIDNTLITSREQAEAVANHQLLGVNQKYIYTANQLNNEDYLLGDKVNINGDDIYVTRIQRQLNYSNRIDTIEGIDV